MPLFDGFVPCIRLLIQDWVVRPVWTGMILGDCRTMPWEVAWICGLIMPCDVSCLCAVMNRRIKGIHGDVVVVMTDRVEDNGLQWCADACEDLMGVFSAGRIPTLVIGRFSCVRALGGCCDWLKGCAVIFIAVGIYKVCIMGRIRASNWVTFVLRYDLCLFCSWRNTNLGSWTVLDYDNGWCGVSGGPYRDYVWCGTLYDMGRPGACCGYSI